MIQCANILLLNIFISDEEAVHEHSRDSDSAINEEEQPINAPNGPSQDQESSGSSFEDLAR